jgi:penicillin-binding protein 2
VKPFVAATALDLGVITPEKEILSTGSLIIPNPYNPDLPSVFKDWRAHGWTDMRNAIAVSSDVYFYQVGGGYEGQQGIGIARLDAYMQKFGFGVAPGSIFTDEAVGVVPTPEWKEAVFDGDPWRLGDTYNTSIGQYGFQVSPLQAVRATAAIANGGSLMTPLIKKDAKPQAVGVGIGEADLQVVREGMRLAVTGPNGTVRALNVPGMSIAGKSGTAQTGVRNESMNSWVIGFWPYENPRYAFAVVLEKAPAGTLSGAPPAMQPFFYWLMREKPEYVY